MENIRKHQSSSLEAATIRLTRLKAIIREYFERAKGSKESEKEERTQQFLSVIQNHSSFASNGPLLVLLCRELMSPDNEDWLHRDFRRSLLKIALTLYHTRIAGRSSSDQRM